MYSKRGFTTIEHPILTPLKYLQLMKPVLMENLKTSAPCPQINCNGSRIIISK